ncbi:hypothetical protein [Paenibacillus sp. Pae108]|uniref:DUF7667 family protein n=1 Tax=Paenibacillus sp. Pae108 TaxID=2926019 RepID=UPI002117ECD6|nr:hypothetical protein [Paenibacillus sp. Pae108]
MFLIHPVHRKLAEIVFMNTDKNGNLVLGNAELQLIRKELRKNMELVYRTDALKELSFIAYLMGDMDWVQEIEKELEEIEAQCIRR